MTPDLFRLGASSLLNDILMQLGRSAPARTSAAITSRWIEHSTMTHD